MISSSMIQYSSRVGKKWEPRNPVPGPFSAKIPKVNQSSESRREFGKLSKKLGMSSGKLGSLGVRPKKRKRKKVLTWAEKFGKFGKIRKVHPEN